MTLPRVVVWIVVAGLVLLLVFMLAYFLLPNPVEPAAAPAVLYGGGMPILRGSPRTFARSPGKEG